MRIGLDAISAVGRGGNSTYSHELIRQLLRLDVSNCYYLFSFLHDMHRPLFKEYADHCVEVHSQLVGSLFPLPHLGMINDFLLRTHARLRKIEVFHFTNPIHYVDGPFKKVVTIHDLVPLHDASWSKRNSGDLFKKKLQHIASADAIIAVSQFTKRDICAKLGVDPRKITVIYEGVGDVFYPDADESAVAHVVGKGRYVLCVGQLQPRKNNLNLIRAFSAIAAEFPDTKLVFVGGSVSSEYLQTLRAVAAAGGISNSVVFAGVVETELLRKLYTLAEGLVYPSFFEGFGLPILEAFQCGIPVITSNTSSLPEVAGDAGILVDPHSSESIADAMRRLLADVAFGKKLRAEIPAQLQKFSWEKAARETLNVYASLA